MSCVCERCGKPNDDCHFRICVWCHLEGQDEPGKNLTLGGNFYEKGKIIPKTGMQEVNNEQVDKQEVVGVSHHGVLRRGNSRGGILDE